MEGDPVASLLPLLVSANQVERTGATMALRDMETQSGFSAHLLEIGARSDVRAQVRWLAMMYLKNQVHRFWVKRSGIPYEIEAAEKIVLRDNILPLSLDVDDAIANQSALIVAKMTRFDFPKVWPNVLESIVSALQAASVESELAASDDHVHRCNRILRVLHYTIKELSSKRLVSDRKTFMQLAPSVVAAVAQLWLIFRSKYISSWSSQSVSEGTTQGLVLTVKTLRRLLVSGFQKLHSDEQATSIAVSISQFFRDLVVSCGNASTPAAGTLERVTYFHGKFVHNLLATQPLALGSEVEAMFVHYLSLCDLSEPQQGIPPRIQTVLLRCLHSTVSSGKFIPSMQGTSRSADDPAQQKFIEDVHKTLLADGLVKIIRGVTCKFVRVRVEEVEEVLEAGVNHLDALERDEEDDFESAGMSECGPSAYFALSIIDALLCRYGSSALNVLVVLQREMLEARPVSFQVIEADLVREACYHVIGSACMTLIKAKDLFEQVAVVNMAGSYLQNEFEIFNGQQGERHPALVLALRRAVWMLGKLVKAEVSEEGSSSMKERSTDFSPLHSTLVPLIYSALEFPVIAGDLQAFLPAICATILKVASPLRDTPAVSSAEDNLEVKNVSVRMLRGLASQIDSKVRGRRQLRRRPGLIRSRMIRAQVFSNFSFPLSALSGLSLGLKDDCNFDSCWRRERYPDGDGSRSLAEAIGRARWMFVLYLLPASKSSASSVEKHSTLFARILASLRISRGPRETLLRVSTRRKFVGESIWKRDDEEESDYSEWTDVEDKYTIMFETKMLLPRRKMQENEAYKR
eukprot:173553-Hanusia_phi.AAC.1